MKDFLQAMGICAVCAAVGLFLIIGLTSAVAKETTTLDEALERPVKVGKFVDKENGVVCYYIGRHPEFINCVKVK